jgi:hypothetical protein
VVRVSSQLLATEKAAPSGRVRVAAWRREQVEVNAEASRRERPAREKK